MSRAPFFYTSETSPPLKFHRPAPPRPVSLIKKLETVRTHSEPWSYTRLPTPSLYSRISILARWKPLQYTDSISAKVTWRCRMTACYILQSSTHEFFQDRTKLITPHILWGWSLSLCVANFNIGQSLSCYQYHVPKLPNQFQLYCLLPVCICLA